MDAFLTKPLDVSGLSAVLERAERTLVRAERKRQSVDLHVGEHIDLGRLTELEELAGDGAAAAALLEEFVSVAQEALEAVRTAGDAARLARAAHRLAGSASTIGAKRIAEMAADLEKRARGGEQPDVAPLIEAVANATFLLSARAARLRGDPATLASTLPPRTG